MNKLMRKIAGFSILAGILGGLFGFMSAMSGLGVAIGIYATGIGIYLLTTLAICLIDSAYNE